MSAAGCTEGADGATVGVAVGGGGGGGGAVDGGWGNGGRAVFGCTGPLRPEGCAGKRIGREVRVGVVRGGGGGEGVCQHLRTTLYTIRISLVFEDEKSNGSDKKLVRRKVSLKKDRQY